MTQNSNAIGVFDSGVGGLTVLHQIALRLPNEKLVYFGDTARVPYGSKSAATVIRYARACANVLLKHDIKLLVVACNTASSVALDILREELSIPVLGVIEPGARSAVRATKSGRIGVIGTVATIRSGMYEAIIRESLPDAEVMSKPCPLFVPLAEEGWVDGAIPESIAEEYLREFLDRSIDTLVLGCTHYPLLKDAIRRVAGKGVTLVDSAEATGEVVVDVLNSMHSLNEELPGSRYKFLVSDDPIGFRNVGERFLDASIQDVEWVDFK